MKFGKRLQSQLEETLPEWRDKYLSYKQLKKRLKSISAPDCFTDAAFSSPERDADVTAASVHTDVEVRRAGSQSASGALNGDPPVELVEEGQGSSGASVKCCSDSGASGGDGLDGFDLSSLTAEESDFIHLLNAELEKFNNFFMEKEEEYVIRLQELKERCERLKEKSRAMGSNTEDDELNEEMILIRKEIVNFHGEMVLLENYSSVNYTGLVKILKKHDKRTGALLRMPYIRNVLQQPFFTTELLSKLVRECEMNLQSLFPFSNDTTSSVTDSTNPPQPSNGEEPVIPDEEAVAEGEDVDNIYRSTLAALRTIKELRKGSSTYSAFSLPPFSKDEDDGEDSNATPNPCAAIQIVSDKQ